jgi:hypothetical protein
MDLKPLIGLLPEDLRDSASELANRVIEGFSNVTVNVLSGNTVDVNVHTHITVDVGVEADHNVDEVSDEVSDDVSDQDSD